MITFKKLLELEKEAEQILTSCGVNDPPERLTWEIAQLIEKTVYENSRARLPWEVYKQIRSRYKSDDNATIKSMVAEFGISKNIIERIIKDKYY